MDFGRGLETEEINQILQENIHQKEVKKSPMVNIPNVAGGKDLYQYKN